MEMKLMALQTKKRFILNQQIVRNGAMGLVTDGTILHNRRMLINKRSLFGGMAIKAQVVFPFGGL